jgi:hypothetical protein
MIIRHQLTNIIRTFSGTLSTDIMKESCIIKKSYLTNQLAIIIDIHNNVNSNTLNTEDMNTNYKNLRDLYTNYLNKRLK